MVGGQAASDPSISRQDFFIKDRIAMGDLTVTHCPTGRMWADIFTKPKQGKDFRVFRGEVMNCPEVYDDAAEAKSDMIASRIKKVCFDTKRNSVKTKTLTSCVHRRSVLGVTQNGDYHRIAEKQ